MKKKLFYNKHKITNRDIAEVIKTLKYQKLSKGEQNNNFSKNLKNFFDCKYCQLVSSGTSAQLILAKSLKWKKGDHIILSPLSFVSGANSVLINNATPVFVDINLKDYNFDYDKLEKKIKILKKNKKKIKAIVSTDYAGIPGNWKKLKKISKKYKIVLINDNCHALGASYQNTKSYALKFADHVIQSFHAVKNITTGEGGALLTNNKKVFEDANRLAQHGFQNPEKILTPWDYEIKKIPGFNFRISDINCAIGNSQLKRLNKIINIRRKLAKIYDKLFSKYTYFKFIKEGKKFKCSYHLYPLSINFNYLKINEKLFYKRMRDKFGITLQKHYKPTYKFKIFSKYISKKKNEFKNTEFFYSNTFSLPLHLDMSKKKIIFVFKSILSSLKLSK